jgi:hypothetical protein
LENYRKYLKSAKRDMDGHVERMHFLVRCLGNIAQKYSIEEGEPIAAKFQKAIDKLGKKKVSKLFRESDRKQQKRERAIGAYLEEAEESEDDARSSSHSRSRSRSHSRERERERKRERSRKRSRSRLHKRVRTSGSPRRVPLVKVRPRSRSPSTVRFTSVATHATAPAPRRSASRSSNTSDGIIDLTRDD